MKKTILCICVGELPLTQPFASTSGGFVIGQNLFDIHFLRFFLIFSFMRVSVLWQLVATDKS